MSQKPTKESSKNAGVSELTLLSRAQGCLLGGALGDALGAPVEFLSRTDIERKFGKLGIRELSEAYGRIGAITDDTQMTLFTAEGIIRANVRLAHRGISHLPSQVAYAYQRWLATQGFAADENAMAMEGWLIAHRELFSRRAPGTTCISALQLRAQRREGKLNDSKGCGTVMRSAPFGFLQKPWASKFAAECSEITHGHPEATASAQLLASIINNLVAGASLNEAIREGLASIDSDSHTCYLVGQAIDRQVLIEDLGEGWVADEAIAIGIRCAVEFEEDFEAAVCMAVNHSGDSDSTGSICGNLLGARYGTSILPERWLAQLELREVIAEVAADLVTEVPAYPYGGATPEQQTAEEAFWEKYKA